MKSPIHTMSAKQPQFTSESCGISRNFLYETHIYALLK